ncbi:OmpA family protein [Spirosoma agri]|uniref:OmpA family protein n=1 Tax=Spirosoma agri TaxID=1987381 RepID=A0A6M0II80_9BACT|nr:OmpA family protein [Spirosoma agri]NEU67405.1 OmpA family protein [Spirosoma agri]
MIRLTLLFSVFPLLTYAQQVDTSACLQIQGSVIDYATHQPLTAARLVAQTATGRVPIGSSGESGRFSGALPCGTTALLISRTDYRNQIIPVQLPNELPEKPIGILIPLVPVDKQNKNTPYLQTEQTSYVQSDRASDGRSVPDSTQRQHNTFVVTDATQSTPLPALVCFFFTKTGIRNCLNTNQEGQFQIDFDQRDIVALEVTAVGYQPYAGNMLVEQLDGRLLKHTIKLQRELTLLTVDAPGASQCELRSKTQTIALTPLSGYAGQYVTYDPTPEPVELIISYQTKKVTRTIDLHAGLNFLTVTQPLNNLPVIPPILGAAAAKTVVADISVGPASFKPDSIPMIYFEQSSYRLRPDSQEVLTQVVRYLNAHPTDSLQITGHTDNVGDPRLNQALSENRARVTATFLTDRGIPESRLTKAGIGSSQPIVPNTTEANRVINRRVSLKLITAQ